VPPGRIRISIALVAVPLMVPSRSSSSGAPVRAQCGAAGPDLDVAGAELDLVVEILELALVPTFTARKFLLPSPPMQFSGL
jgi:hypothetical protein